MDTKTIELVLKATDSEQVINTEPMQTLWSGYGTIYRITLDTNKKVVVK